MAKEAILVNVYPMQRDERTRVVRNREHSMYYNPSATLATDYQFMKDFPE